MSTQEPAPDEPTDAASTQEPGPQGGEGGDDPQAEHRILVVSPEGIGVAGGSPDESEDPAGLIDQPAKVMRIGTMIKQLLDEVRNGPLDEAARTRLAEIHERSLAELEQGLSAELVAELDRITLPFGEDPAPTDAELRIAQAQLVGWLEGLFRGIQTAMVAQQVAAQAAQQRSMRGLPPGVDPRVMGPGPGPRPSDGTGTGQYL